MIVKKTKCMVIKENSNQPKKWEWMVRPLLCNRSQNKDNLGKPVDVKEYNMQQKYEIGFQSIVWCYV